MLYLCSADWVAGLGLGSAYANSMAMSLTPSLHSTSHLTPLTPQAQSLPLDMYPDMPELTFKHGHYLTVDSQLPRSAESLMVPPLYHDVSSQESNSSYSPPEARLPSESPSFQDTDTTPSAEAPKKPRRSRPNRYKNAAPAVIQVPPESRQQKITASLPQAQGRPHRRARGASRPGRPACARHGPGVRAPPRRVRAAPRDWRRRGCRPPLERRQHGCGGKGVFGARVFCAAAF